MQGHIIYFDEVAGRGVLADEIGARYRFLRAEWRSRQTPRSGAVVDFLCRKGVALEVYALEHRTPRAGAAVTSQDA